MPFKKRSVQTVTQCTRVSCSLHKVVSVKIHNDKLNRIKILCKTFMGPTVRKQAAASLVSPVQPSLILPP